MNEALLNDPRVLYSVAGGIAFIIFLWIVWAVRLLVTFGRYEKAAVEFARLTYERANVLPLFMSLMEAHIAKAEEVFTPAIALRRKLLAQSTLADEDEMTHQVTFLMTVADQHPELGRERKFAHIRAEMEQCEQALERPRDIVGRSVKKWNSMLRHGKWFLFPGGWFLQKM